MVNRDNKQITIPGGDGFWGGKQNRIMGIEDDVVREVTIFF